MTDYDYLIVGAGSAGCVLSNRLSADPANRVLLLEAGGEDGALSLRIPSAMATNLNSTKHNWAYEGEPEPHYHGRVMKHDRGKGIGGSSSINGMCFIRGHARDFDGWRQMGCEGWGWADVLPYFKRLENYSSGGETRGTGGPMEVLKVEPYAPLDMAFLKAGEQAGYPLTDDISGVRQEGFGRFDRTTRNGERFSAARGYLDEARIRPNLEVRTGAPVDRLLFEGRRVVGIVCKGAEIRAREVVLSAGAVATPAILLRSGIGPEEHLDEMGIEVVADRRGVGANLNDHPDFVMKFKCLQPISLKPHTTLLGRLKVGLRWLLKRDGICATNHFEVLGCVRSRAGVEYPDLQFCLMPLATGEDWAPMPFHGFQIPIGLMRARSRGRVWLRSANPDDPPRLLVNYMDDPEDLRVLRDGIRLVRELIAQPAFEELAGEEVFPGAAAQTDDELDEAVRAECATQWHLSGTARMGAADDPDAVVDAEGRVIGVEGVRVVDASVMPQVTNANTNAPTLMIAEKMADAILGKAPLPPEPVDVWVNPDWATSQR